MKMEAGKDLAVYQQQRHPGGGRLFSYVSLVGHFSFLVFTSYVLILFPLTFIVVSAPRPPDLNEDGSG
jgi:membrane-anchored protein YejM (alkaline phosphatase superfamily)